ncbi:MAG TPA: hypothetical protein VIV11_42540 [Kofleriaceae bacterium]
MADRQRAIVLDHKTVVLASGEQVTTFEGCDAEYLADEGIAPGDVVSFTTDDVGYVFAMTKVKPTPAQLRTLQQALANARRGVRVRSAASARSRGR